jgi:CheY-like chemotaxis protein
MGMNTKKILIVVDHPDSRELFALILGRLGYDVVKAATGLEALDRVRATSPNLIIMDLGITAYETIERLKADPSTMKTPVIVSTAFRKGELVERAIAAGAAEIMHKPVSLKDLQDVAQRYLFPDYDRNAPPSKAAIFSVRPTAA